MGYSDSEIIIRKCTDSDFPEISSFHYPEAKRTLISSFELDKAINFLLTRIFTEPGSNPVRVFKSLDLATYLLINGNREIEQKLKSYRSSFKGLKSVIFEPSIYSEKSNLSLDLQILVLIFLESSSLLLLNKISNLTFSLINILKKQIFNVGTLTAKFK